MTAIASQTGRAARAEIISDPAAFTALREEWNELLQDSESDGFFLTWEWLHSWWKHLAENRRLFLLVVRAGERLVAIAPFAVRPFALLRTPPLRCIEMLGSGVAGSDYLDVIVRRGWEQECAAALTALLEKRGEMVVLSRLRSETSFARALVSSLESKGFRSQQSMAEVCPFVTRPPGGFAEYLASLGTEHRYAFRRKVQALHKRHKVSFDAAQTEAQRHASLESLIELHKKRWSRHGTSEAFTSPAIIAFHEEVSALSLERGWLRLFVLRADDQPVAALYGFRYGRIFYFYQSGFDPIWGKQSVGLVTMGLAIENAFNEGVDEFDLLHGDEAYKFHWAREVHPLTRVELFPPGVRGVVSQGICALAKSARRIGKRLLRPQETDGQASKDSKNSKGSKESGEPREGKQSQAQGARLNQDKEAIPRAATT